MHNIFQKFNIQFFADGADGADGEGTSTGVNAVAAEQQTGVNAAAAEQCDSLEALGVPKAKAERYRALKGKRAQASTPAAAEDVQKSPEQAAAAEEPAEATVSKPTWEDISKDPDYKPHLTEMMRARTKKLQDKIEATNPILDLLSKKYGVAADDMEGLASKVRDDSYFYEEDAEKLGLDVETAKVNIQRELDLNARERVLEKREKEEKDNLEQQAVRRHLEKLEQQAQEFRKQIPGFDLQKEMLNPQFLRMTSPSGGLSVEDAYYALHHKEIEEAKAAETARNVAQAYSNSIRSGRKIPTENGTNNKGNGSVTEKLYSQMSKEERAEYKARLQRSALDRR